MAGRVVVVAEPDGWMILDRPSDDEYHGYLHDAFHQLPYVKSSEEMLPTGTWAITFGDCPLPDEEIVQQCCEVLARFLVPVKGGKR
jgi:hypothetical protein